MLISLSVCTGVPPSQTPAAPHLSGPPARRSSLPPQEEEKVDSPGPVRPLLRSAVPPPPPETTRKPILASMDTADPDHATLLWSPRDYRPHSPQTLSSFHLCSASQRLHVHTWLQWLLLFSFLLRSMCHKKMLVFQGFALVHLPSNSEGSVILSRLKKNILNASSYLWDLVNLIRWCVR